MRSFHVLVTIVFSLWILVPSGSPIPVKEYQESPSLARSKRARSGRRNDKMFSLFSSDVFPNDKQSLFKPGKPSQPKRKMPFPKAERRNSPITYIKLPANPYSFIPGQGYVSQASPNPLIGLFSSMAQQQTQARTKSTAADSPISASGEQARTEEEHSGSVTSGRQNNVRPEPPKRGSSLLNMAFLKSIAKVYRPPVKFVSNARPFNVYQWPYAALMTTTTTPTTTTTTTTTTTSPVDRHDKGKSENTIDKTQNSPIVWLGKFLFNGMPNSVSRFQSPFSPLYWYDSIKDIKYPSSKLFNKLF